MADSRRKVIKKAGNLNLLNLEYFLVAAAELNFTRIILETKNINIVLSLCFEGMGALVCPNSFLHPFRHQLQAQQGLQLSVFPLHYSDDIMVSYLSGKYFSLGAQKFKAMIQEIGSSISKQAVWEN